ncbi:hypothetical protein LTR36_007798 [Oleoguttula mirabilis]|uniref:J domain-containing protein n=1 Tax=Oleoguttula mirabilis TaxID=1507867 RepID=A0AAV9J9Y6_9PEZI|nr:hypothetical protein LTR36_007798 [Oleoguttula mirabilis]
MASIVQMPSALRLTCPGTLPLLSKSHSTGQAMGAATPRPIVSRPMQHTGTTLTMMCAILGSGADDVKVPLIACPKSVRRQGIIPVDAQHNSHESRQRRQAYNDGAEEEPEPTSTGRPRDGPESSRYNDAESSPHTRPLDNQALYDVLSLARTATADEVRKAYYKLAKKYHPDRNAAGGEMFKRIKDAYDILCDAEKRRVYDERGYDAATAMGK